MSFRPIWKTAEHANNLWYGDLIFLCCPPPRSFQVQWISFFRKFQKGITRMRFEKYNLHFPPIAGRPPWHPCKEWDTVFPSSWREPEGLMAGESCVCEDFLFPGGFTFYSMVLTWPSLYLLAHGFLSIVPASMYPNAHIREEALCCIYVCRVTSCIQAYKQSEVKTISSESSFVFDGPVSTLQQQHCQPVTVLQHLPPNAMQVRTCATTMGIVSHSVCHHIKS